MPEIQLYTQDEGDEENKYKVASELYLTAASRRKRNILCIKKIEEEVAIGASYSKPEKGERACKTKQQKTGYTLKERQQYNS